MKKIFGFCPYLVQYVEGKEGKKGEEQGEEPLSGRGKQISGLCGSLQSQEERNPLQSTRKSGEHVVMDQEST